MKAHQQELQKNALFVVDGLNIADDIATVHNVARGVVRLKIAVTAKEVLEPKIAITELKSGNPKDPAVIQAEAVALIQCKPGMENTIVQALETCASGTSFSSCCQIKSSEGRIVITIKELEAPVHSGFGLMVPDASQDVAALITGVEEPSVSRNGGLAFVLNALTRIGEIPGFMEGALPIDRLEREDLQAHSVTQDAYRNEMGVLRDTLRGDPKTSVYERLIEMGALSVQYMGGGEAVIGVRTVAGQDAVKVGVRVMEYIKTLSLPQGVSVNVEQYGTAVNGWKGNASGEFTRKYYASAGQYFKEVVTKPNGATVGLLDIASRVLPGTEVVKIGVGGPKSNMHAPNEEQKVSILRNVIDTIIAVMGP